jgi:anti-anti-sigma regulatory factor
MELVVDHAQARVQITIIRVKGNLDGSNYQSLIAQAKELYAGGARDMLIDLSGCDYVSSAGLVALHSVVKMLRGDAPMDPNAGWDALHDIDREEGKAQSLHLRLLNPQPRVDHVLEIAGMKSFLPIYTDLQTAIAAF